MRYGHVGSIGNVLGGAIKPECKLWKRGVGWVCWDAGVCDGMQECVMGCRSV